MSAFVAALQQQLQQLQQLMAAEIVDTDAVQALTLQLHQQLPQLTARADSPQQAGEFLLAVQQWLQQSQQRLEAEKLQLAEQLRGVQKGRHGTQIYQTHG